MGDDIEDFTVLLDFKDWGYSNVDYAGVTTGVQMLQKYYPERLGMALCINTPWIFNAVWAVVSPLLNEVTRSKVVFVGAEYKTKLLEYFESDQLLPEHGGTSTYEWAYPGWPERALYIANVEYDTDYEDDDAEPAKSEEASSPSSAEKDKEDGPAGSASPSEPKKSSWLGFW